MGLNIRLKGYVYREYLYIVGYGNGSTTTLPLEVFTQRNLVADFIRLNLNFIHKNDKFAFLTHPLNKLEVTYALHLWLVGKRVIDFPFAIIEHFR